MASRFAFEFSAPTTRRTHNVTGIVQDNDPDYDTRVDVDVDGRRVFRAQLVDSMLHHAKWTPWAGEVLGATRDRDALLDHVGRVAATA